MPRSWGLLSWVLVLLGCGADSEVRVELPYTLDAQGSVLAFVSSSAGLMGSAFDLSNSRVRFEARIEGAASVTLLRYGHPLADLGGEEGPLELSETSGRLLLEPDAILEGVLGEDEIQWQPRQELSGALRRLRTRSLQDPCVAFDIQRSVVQDSGSHSSYVNALLPDGTVLIAPSSGGLMQGGHAGWRDLPFVSKTATIARIIPGEDGSVWLFRTGGAVDHVDLEGGRSTPGPMHPDQPEALAVAGSRRGPFEALAVDGIGRVRRFDGHEWTSVREATGPESNPRRVHWVEPGVFLIAAEPGEMDRYEDGVLTRETYQLNAPLLAIFSFEETGVLFYDDSGRLLRYLPGGLLEPLRMPPNAAGSNTLLPFRRGFVFGGRSGLLTQYDSVYGFCDVFPASTRIIRSVGAIGDAIVFVERPEIGLTYDLITLTPRL